MELSAIEPAAPSRPLRNSMHILGAIRQAQPRVRRWIGPIAGGNQDVLNQPTKQFAPVEEVSRGAVAFFS